ncbi:MAG: Rep protein [CRESS virus sp. ctpVY4]|nr:MAG: Rep protein [CRESS virus sp. ctpVY4]
MYFNGMFNLDSWDIDAEYAVFDDWEDWTKFYLFKQFLGAQQEFDITDKYRRKTRVRWGKPCIVLSNDLPSFYGAHGAWCDANTILVVLRAGEYFF